MNIHLNELRNDVKFSPVAPFISNGSLGKCLQPFVVPSSLIISTESSVPAITNRFAIPKYKTMAKITLIQRFE